MSLLPLSRVSGGVNNVLPVSLENKGVAVVPKLSHWQLLLAGRIGQGEGPSKPVSASTETAEMYFQKGLKFSDQKKWREALVELRRAIALNPELPGLRLALINTLELSGNVKAVENEFQAWLKEEGNNLQILSAWGSFLNRQKRFAESIVVWKVMLDKKEGDAHSLYHLALAYIRSDRSVESIPLLERAIGQQPDSSELRKWLGFAQYSIGKKDDAIATWKMALDLAPHDPQLHYNLGKVYFDQQRYSDSLLEAEEALLWKPGDPQIEDLRKKSKKTSQGEMVQTNVSLAGLIQEPLWEEKPLAQIDEMLRQRGSAMTADEFEDLSRRIILGQRFLDAIFVLNMAIKQYPESSILYALSGDVLFELGRFEMALQSYQQALKFNPENEKLKTAIQKVQSAKEKQLKPATNQLP